MTIPLISRTCLVLSALVATTGESDAQGWEVGAKSGLSQSRVSQSREFVWNRSTPSSIGFLARRWFGPVWIQPELAYARATGVSTAGGSSLTMVADFIELPLLVQARYTLPFGLTPFVAGGPSPAFRVRCRLQFAGGGIKTDDDCAVRAGASRQVDVAIVGSAGVAWHLRGFTPLLESRFRYGLVPNVLPTGAAGARRYGWSLLGGASVPLYRQRRVPPVRLPVPLLAQVPSAPAAPATVPLIVPVGYRVTLTAEDVAVREVLEGIAEMTGLRVVVSSQITQRVSVNFSSVRAEEAVQAVADAAGLAVLPPDRPGAALIVVPRVAARPR